MSLHLAPSSQALDHPESQLAKDRAKQQRQGRACDTCRRRKVRCEGGAPAIEAGDVEHACTLCVAQGIPCTYEQRSTKRGPPKGYVESLERRLEAMEQLLAQFAGKEGRPAAQDGSTHHTRDSRQPPRRDSPHDDDDDAALFPASIAATPGSSSTSATPCATGLDAIDELSMKLDDLAVEQNRYVGRGSGMHIVRSMQQYAEPSSPSVLEEAVPSSIETLLREEHDRHRTDIALPSPELAQKLIDAAFNEFQVRWVLPRAFFDDCVNRGLLESDPSFKGLYFAILAVGSRAVPNTMDSARSPNETRIVEGWTWFKASLGASGSPLESASLFTLLRTTMLSAWQLGCSGFISCWATAGWGVRQAIDVGAHCENRADWIASPLRNQLRKRAFFTLVALDYYLSSTLGRPFAIQEDDWDVTPPLSLSDEDLIEWDRQTHVARLNGHPLPPQPAESSYSTAPASPVVPVQSGGYPWQSMMALHSIIAKTMKSLYGLRRDKTLKGTKDAVRDLDSQLNAWLEKVPAHLRWNPAQQDDEALLLSASMYSTYYMSQILVHREYISPSRSAALGFPSLAICSNAARSSAHVLDTLRQRGLLYRAYAYAPVMAVSNASILLLGRFASPDANAQLTPSAAADVKRCINVLHDLAPTTYLALRCYEGMIRLASLVTSPPSARGLNSLSSSTCSINKRPLPSDWADGQSPAASASDRPSPSSPTSDSRPSAAGGGGSFDPVGHKQRKVTSHAVSRGPVLPLSTSDLSAETFKGRPTFAIDTAADGTQSSHTPHTTVPGSHGHLPFGHNSSTSADGAPVPIAVHNPFPSTSLATFPTTHPSQFPPPVPELGVAENHGRFNESAPLHHPPYLGATPTPSDYASLPVPPPAAAANASATAAFDPNLSTPLASSMMSGLDFDLGTDFFSYAFNGTENHIPADVGRAAADLWNSFSSNPQPIDPAPAGVAPGTDPSGGGGGGGGGTRSSSTWNPSPEFGTGMNHAPNPSSFDPFSHWNFASPSRTDSEPASHWNGYYDSNTFGSTN
ncbi:hypothetical protein JCM11491_003032 [Sporobolomyces phaffii]